MIGAIRLVAGVSGIPLGALDREVEVEPSV